MVHYYATIEFGVENEENQSIENDGNDGIVDENITNIDNNQLEGNHMPLLSSFLKLPNARVNEKYSHESGYIPNTHKR